jgi:hypothetical protein
MDNYPRLFTHTHTIAIPRRGARATCVYVTAMGDGDGTCRRLLDRRRGTMDEETRSTGDVRVRSSDGRW